MVLLKLGLITALASSSGVSELPSKSESDLLGSWEGIQIFQDANSYDGETFFLPNKEELIIDKDKIKIYYYPYSKVDEFPLSFSKDKLKYKLKDSYTESYYSISNDTLTMKMYFINKTFVKKYVRKEFDTNVIAELDEYGFNPSSLEHEFELDTFHNELKTGFDYYDSLSFKPLRHLQFLGDEKIIVNKNQELKLIRGFNTIRFTLNGIELMFEIAHSEGTQHLSLIPSTQCGCDDISIPYMTVSWANRIRQAIIDELEWD